MSPPALRAHLLAYARPRLGALRRRVSPEELADVVDLALAARERSTPALRQLDRAARLVVWESWRPELEVHVIAAAAAL